ncbi:MAG: hypothetical protein JSS89_13200 [Bacteroidetes bacterium]|nr:hypothetical protein [Bacteroidota bacterium]
MRNIEILEMLEVEDLPDDLRTVAEACGIDVVKSLLIHHGGATIYVPQVTKMPELIRRYLLARYDGRNAADIARDLHVSHRYVKKQVTMLHRKRGGVP